MRLIDIVVLTFINSVTCLVLPKVISSVFSAKPKKKTISKPATIALEEAG